MLPTQHPGAPRLSIHSLKDGDKVSFQGHPLRDGGPAAYLMNVTTASGAVLKDHDY